MSDESEKPAEMNEQTPPAPAASPLAPRKLTPYTPPVRITTLPQPAIPPQLTPASPALPPVPRPVIKPPTRPVHRAAPANSEPNTPRRESQHEPIETTRLTAPPKMNRSAPPPLPEKIEEEPTRTPTRRPPEKPPEPPAEPEIDALAKKTAPLPIAARPASPPPVRQEPSEQTAVVRPPPIPAPQRETVSPPSEAIPQSRDVVRAPVTVEQRATDAQQSAPPAIVAPADVRAKTPMTMLPVEGPPAEAKLSIKMATAEEGIIG